MRFEDAGEEEGVRGMDCAAEAEGGVDPERERIRVDLRRRNAGCVGKKGESLSGRN